MPRNGTGVMSVLSTFSPGTSISSAQMNALLADIATELTNSDPRDGSVARTGPANLGGNYAESAGISIPSAPAAGKGRSYWRTVGGTARPFARLSDGKEYEQINYVITPQQFGAKADGVTDDTAAVQAAIAAADALPHEFNANVVFFPPGTYLVTGITSSRPHAYIGSGKLRTTFRLKANSNTSVWTHSLPGGPTGGSPAFFTYPVFEGFTIEGNKANQTGTFGGLVFPAPAWSLATQYSLSGYVTQVDVGDCAGPGFFIGENRGGGSFYECTAANCGTGWHNEAFDNHFYSCYAYGSTYGYHSAKSGGSTLVSCSFFSNTTCMLISDTTTAYIIAQGLVLDGSSQQLLIINGGGQQSMQYSFSNSRFLNVGTSAPGTFPAVALGNVYGASFVGCTFDLGTSRSSYLVESSSGGAVQWVGNDYRTDAGNEPWNTALTNDFTKLVLGGDRAAQIRRNATGDILLIPPASGQVRVKGTPTNDSATAGDVGEIVSSEVQSGSAVALTTNVQANVTSISLPAGDWDVVGSVALALAANTSISAATASISNASATLDLGAGRFAILHRGSSIPGGNIGGQSIGPTRLSLASTTTIYLVVSATFSTSTCAAYGAIRARRVR